MSDSRKYRPSVSNKRLKEARDRAGFKSASGAAKNFEWPVATYLSHENGQTKIIPPDAAKKYGRAFNVSPAWLLNLDNNINQPDKNVMPEGDLTSNRFVAPATAEANGLTSVPEMGAVWGANTDVRTDNQETSGDEARVNWGIPSPFLESEFHIAPDDRAVIVPVRSDSMTSALSVGDRAIINLNDIDIGEEGIFALIDDAGKQIIRQVEIVRGSKGRRILCTARNPQYKPFELELTDPVRIIGRVAGKISRHL